jgi:hypothetical protein
MVSLEGEKCKPLPGMGAVWWARSASPIGDKFLPYGIFNATLLRRENPVFVQISLTCYNQSTEYLQRSTGENHPTPKPIVRVPEVEVVPVTVRTADVSIGVVERAAAQNSTGVGF